MFLSRDYAAPLHEDARVLHGTAGNLDGTRIEIHSGLRYMLSCRKASILNRERAGPQRCDLVALSELAQIPFGTVIIPFSTFNEHVIIILIIIDIYDNDNEI